MQQGLLGGAGRQNQEPPWAMIFGIPCLALVAIFSLFCVKTLEPNEYGLLRNYMTGSVAPEVQRGGIHFLMPFQGYEVFPAAQLILEFSSRSPDRPPVMTRTGADPQDPASGGQPIKISCAVQAKFVENKLANVYLSFGSRQAAMERYFLLSGNMVSNTAQDFVPTDFWTSRDRIADTMLRKINETFWNQGYIEAVKFEILKVDFAEKFEDSITAIQVAEQQKVVNEYEQQVQQVVQQIEVMRSENNAVIANISGGAVAFGKETQAWAKRDAFAMKQDMKAQKYGQLQEKLELNPRQMQDFFRIQVLQSPKAGKTVIGMPTTKAIQPGRTEL